MKKFLHLINARWPYCFPCLFLIVGFAFVGCAHSVQNASSMEESEKKEIQSAVINRFNEMIKYAEAGDIENLLTYFDPSAGGSYIDGATRYATFQEMADSYRASWKVLKQDFGIPDTRLLILSSDFVLITSTSTLNTANTDGIVFRPRPWSITTLWQLKAGQWQIHSYHQFTGEAVRVEEKQPV